MTQAELQALLDSASCIRCFTNPSTADLLRLALLSQIAEGSGGGGGGSPGGPLNAVQFNSPLGTFSGSADLTFNDATNLLSLNGTVVIPGTGAYSSSGALNLTPAAAMNMNLNVSAGGQVLATGDINLYDDTGTFAFSIGTLGDVRLTRDAAEVFAQRRTTNAQTFRVYRTFTDSTNYERLALQSAAGQMILAAETAGTGTDNIDLLLTSAGTGIVNCTQGIIRHGAGFTVGGTLPAAGTVGRRAYVTNALAPAFGAVVAGGGAVVIPVFDDGTNWIVG